MSQKKTFCLLLTTHFLTVYLPQFSLILYIFLFSLLLALTHTALQDCNVLNLTHGDLSSSPLHQMAEWSSFYFFIFSFFSSFQHASHQITINASTLALTFVHDIDIRQKGWIQFFSSLGWTCLCFLRPIFLLPSACPTRLMSSLVKRYGWLEYLRAFSSRIL